MRTKLTYIAIATTLSLAIACNNTEPSETPSKPKAKTYTDSQLTLYMRGMEVEAKQWREQIIAGQSLSLPVGILDSIRSAEPTEGKIKDREKFEAHAAFFQQHIDSLELAPTEQLSSQYNLMVTACIDCHQSFCPGPIKRIKKLYIAE